MLTQLTHRFLHTYFNEWAFKLKNCMAAKTHHQIHGIETNYMHSMVAHINSAKLIGKRWIHLNLPNGWSDVNLHCLPLVGEYLNYMLTVHQWSWLEITSLTWARFSSLAPAVFTHISLYNREKYLLDAVVVSKRLLRSDSVRKKNMASIYQCVIGTIVAISLAIN